MAKAAAPGTPVTKHIAHFVPPDAVLNARSTIVCTAVKPYDRHKDYGPDQKTIVYHQNGVLQSGTTYSCVNCKETFTSS